jgi:ribosomal protein S18 acetylase RimI-like enzyme
MKITRITQFDERVFEAVIKFIPQLSPGSELPTRQHLIEILKSKNIHFFILEPENNMIAGMLTIATYLIPTGTKTWIEDVVVDESVRGKGYGEDLIKFALDYSKSLGAKAVRLTSRPSRIAANRLYVKMGFVRYETNLYEFVFTP